MAKEFFVECPKCGADVDFNIQDIDDLEDHIANEVDDAKREAEKQFEGMIDPADFCGDVRVFRELAAAIVQGDRDEAEYLLDKIADEIGSDAINQVSLGRFGHRVQS